MPIITKTKPHFRSVNGNVGEYGFSESISYSTSLKVNGKYTAFQRCDHKKLISAGSRYQYAGGYVENWAHPEVLPWNVFLQYGLSQAYLELDFQENNSFELIPFLMDWDSTLAMFTKKFIRELSYGAVTWGVLPFIQDIKSLAASLQDINDGIYKSYSKINGKRITRRFPWEHYTTHDWREYRAKGHTTIFGTVTGDLVYPDSVEKAVAVFLDELGLNPDLKTLWDIIPFSFVVDYFLPIGDFLESLHPRGWFNPSFTIDGGYSVKYVVEDSIVASWPYGGKSGPCTWTHYFRSPGSLTLKSRPPVEPKYESPSFRELFNTLYLSFLSKK